MRTQSAAKLITKGAITLQKRCAELEAEKIELLKLLDECFENGIAALGADCNVSPSKNSEDLAYRVYALIKELK